jgi:hypothetical protein
MSSEPIDMGHEDCESCEEARRVVAPPPLVPTDSDLLRKGAEARLREILGPEGVRQAPEGAAPGDLAAQLTEVHCQLGGAMDYIRDGEGESAIGRIETAREKLDEIEAAIRQSQGQPSQGAEGAAGIVRDLAAWSKRWPRATIRSYSETAKCEGELKAIEDAAREYAEGQEKEAGRGH